MRLAVLAISTFYCFACSPVTSKEATDANVAGAADSAVTIDASAFDAMPIADGNLGGACFPNNTCNGSLVCNPQQHCEEAPCMPSNIVYLNKDGGTYTSGPENSRTNTSSIPSSTVVLTPRTITAQNWAQLLNDTRQLLAGYDVAVVDVDPGNVPHVEIVLTDSSGSAFNAPGALGISPGCTTEFSVIGFMFPAGGVTVPLSRLVASRIGLTMGMSYTTQCDDLMTYSLSCVGPSFSDSPLSCGQTAVAPCRCDPSTNNQNSHQKMIEKLGARICP